MNISIDITVRRERELKEANARKQFEQKVLQSERHYRTLIENSFEAVIIADKNGIFTYASPSVKKVLGFTPKEIIGMSTVDLFPPEYRAEEIKKFGTFAATPGATIKVENRYLHKNGKTLIVESSISNLLHDPFIQGFVSNFKDITKRKNLEQQKDEFIGIASHELKTPVTSIKAYAQLLESRFRKEGHEQSALYLTRMNTQLNKLTGLIGDLLDVTKIETGKLEFDEEYFDVQELIREIVSEIQLTTEKHTIITELKPTKQLFGDRDRIGQVITNFLTNAVKYSPKGQKIIVSTKVSDNSLVVSVTDFGIGIAKDLSNRVFERFFRVQTPSGQTFPGMGLGLYISSQIIKRQQGEIWVESSKGKGSTFSFSIPFNRKPTRKK
jgi:PAS domain S-box-containing protein